MPKRFVPALHESRRVLDNLHDRLKQSVENADGFWIEALSAVFGPDLRALSASDVHSILLEPVKKCNVKIY
ncbi:MAG: hypothetical protein H0U76_19705 [Ktedonobacteraceae bacterium]|nr:hypothetical protein [Ktedonobacteraceae bacterium]